jgi:hypothetical protein
MLSAAVRQTRRENFQFIHPGAKKIFHARGGKKTFDES